jgi:hypothetical protein
VNQVLIRIQAELGSLKQELQAVKASVQDATGTMKGAFEGIKGSAIQFGLAINGAREALRMMTAPIASVVQASASFETLQARLESLYGSADRGAQAFKTLSEVAATTPFSLEDVVQAGVSLKSFGVDAEKTAKSVADLAAFMGTTATEAARALGVAFAGGVGAADVLRNQGVLNLIKSFKGVEDLTTLTLPEFRDALIACIEDPTVGIAGSTDRLSQTFSGMTSNLGDSIDQLRAAIGNELLPMLKENITGLTEWVNDARGRIEEFKNALRPAIYLLAGFAVSAGIKAIPVVIAGIVGWLVRLQAALWGTATASAAATGGISAIAAAAGVATVGALAFHYMAGQLSSTTTAIQEAGKAAETYKPPLENLGLALQRLGDAGLGDTESELKTLIQSLQRFKDMKQVDLGMIFTAPDAKTFTPDPDKIRLSHAQILALEGTLQARLKDLIDKGAKERKRAADDIAKAERDAAIREAEWELEQQDKRRAAWDRAGEEAAAAQAALLEKQIQRQSDTIDDAIRADMDRWQRQVEQLSGFLTLFGQGIRDSMEGLFEKGWPGLRKGLHDMLMAIVDGIEQLLLATKIKALAEAIVSAKFNPALTVTALTHKLPAIIGLEAMFAALRASVSMIRYEHGGVVDRPTLAWVGENVRASGPEIVAPRTGFRRELRAWAEEVLLPVVVDARAGGSPGVESKLDTLIATVASTMNPDRFGRAVGRQLAVSTRGLL